MLPPFIIDQIRKREEEERAERELEQPRLELPNPSDAARPGRSRSGAADYAPESDDLPNRGVMILQL